MSSVQLYTLEEIKKNNGKDGAPTWIVIRDIVYDVTTYLNEVSIRNICHWSDPVRSNKYNSESFQFVIQNVLMTV